jgi:hypothetical protein
MKKELENIRKQLGLGKVPFSKQIGICVNTYTDWLLERKKVRNCVLKKLTNYYNQMKGDVQTQSETIVETTQSKIFVEEKQSKGRKVEKQLLYSPEELMEELNEGSRVYIEGTRYSLKKQNGFIIRYADTNMVSLNAPILLSESYYVYKEIPLNVKIGGRYKNGKGEVVTIYKQREEGEFIGVFDYTGNTNFYNSKGDCVSMNATKEDNLIEEKK